VAKKFRLATSFESVSAKLAGLPSKAYMAGLNAKRTYSASFGPMDADLIDFVFGEVQRFVDSGELPEAQSAGLLWNRSLQEWELGNFPSAIKDAESALVFYRKTNTKHAENIELSLRLMSEGKPPLALLDYSKSFG